jgi:hypothetical protein
MLVRKRTLLNAKVTSTSKIFYKFKVNNLKNQTSNGCLEWNSFKLLPSFQLLNSCIPIENHRHLKLLVAELPHLLQVVLDFQMDTSSIDHLEAALDCCYGEVGHKDLKAKKYIYFIIKVIKD